MCQINETFFLLTWKNSEHTCLFMLSLLWGRKTSNRVVCLFATYIQYVIIVLGMIVLCRFHTQIFRLCVKVRLLITTVFEWKKKQMRITTANYWEFRQLSFVVYDKCWPIQAYRFVEKCFMPFISFDATSQSKYAAKSCEVVSKFCWPLALIENPKKQVMRKQREQASKQCKQSTFSVPANLLGSQTIYYCSGCIGLVVTLP